MARPTVSGPPPSTIRSYRSRLAAERSAAAISRLTYEARSRLLWAAEHIHHCCLNCSALRTLGGALTILPTRLQHAVRGEWIPTQVDNASRGSPREGGSQLCVEDHRSPGNLRQLTLPFLQRCKLLALYLQSFPLPGCDDVAGDPTT